MKIFIIIVEPEKANELTGTYCRAFTNEQESLRYQASKTDVTTKKITVEI